jgi:hypothetical protein
MDLLNTLQRINTNYGRGDVVSASVNRKNGTGVAVIQYGWVGKGQTKFTEHRLFAVVGNKVRFRGVTRKIG